MKCSNWYLDNKYKSKEDCLANNQGQETSSESNVPSVTKGFTEIETGDTTTSPNQFWSTSPEKDNLDDQTTEDSQLVILSPSDEFTDSDSQDDWGGPYKPTTSMDGMVTTPDTSTKIFSTGEQINADTVQIQETVEVGQAELHVEVGGLKLGIVIGGTAVGVLACGYGIYQLGNYITDNFINRNDIVENPERSHVPLTAVQPTAPQDSRDIEETVASYNTACESTLVEGKTAGTFTPPAFSPIRQASSLPNVQASSSAKQKPTIERTQSTIVFNLDDTVGGEFDAIANRNQPAQMDLSRLSDLPSTSQIFRDVERKNKKGDSDGSGTSTGGQSDTSVVRKSTRIRKQFKPTQYEDL